MRYTSRILILIGLFAISAPSFARASKQANGKNAWTLMIYMDADNSLETSQLANVKEMLSVGSSDNVQILLLCDRSPKSEPKDQYTDEAIGGQPNWSGARLLHVEKDKLKLVADWGDTNMADPATLRKFLEAGEKAYPANHYGLIIADHGSGWDALCVDESSGDKVMSLRDLRSALEPLAAKEGKLDLVGLDACLMASFETAQALAPVAHIMVASQDRSRNHRRRSLILRRTHYGGFARPCAGPRLELRCAVQSARREAHHDEW